MKSFVSVDGTDVELSHRHLTLLQGHAKNEGFIQLPANHNMGIYVSNYWLKHSVTQYQICIWEIKSQLNISQTSC